MPNIASLFIFKAESEGMWGELEWRGLYKDWLVFGFCCISGGGRGGRVVQGILGLVVRSGCEETRGESNWVRNGLTEGVHKISRRAKMGPETGPKRVDKILRGVSRVEIRVQKVLRGASGVQFQVQKVSRTRKQRAP